MGMETSISVRTTFTNGFVLEKEICYLCKHWIIRDELLRIINHTDSDGGTYKITRTDIQDINAYFYHMMIHDDVDDFDDRGSLINFLIRCGAIIGELEATYRYLDKQIDYLTYYEDEIVTVTFDPSELCVDKVEVFFEDSP